MKQQIKMKKEEDEMRPLKVMYLNQSGMHDEKKEWLQQRFLGIAKISHLLIQGRCRKSKNESKKFV